MNQLLKNSLTHVALLVVTVMVFLVVVFLFFGNPKENGFSDYIWASNIGQSVTATAIFCYAMWQIMEWFGGRVARSNSIAQLFYQLMVLAVAAAIFCPLYTLFFVILPNPWQYPEADIVAYFLDADQMWYRNAVEIIITIATIAWLAGLTATTEKKA